MKKLFVIILCALTAVLSCTPDEQLERIDREIASLRQENLSLYEELSADIDATEQRLLEKIDQVQKRLGGDIDAAFADLMNLITYKMEEAEDYLQTELLAKKQRCDQTVLEVRSNIDKVKRRLDGALSEASTYLMEALKKGDEETEKKLNEAIATLGDIEAASDYIDHNMLLWKSRLDQLQSSGLYDAMDAMDEAVRTLSSFNIQKETEAMEARIKVFTAIKMDDLSGQEMLELKELISMMEDWVGETDDLASETASMVDEMGSNLDDWQSLANDYYSQIESRSQDVLNAFEDIYGELDIAAGTVDELLAGIDAAGEEIRDYSATLEDALSELESFHDRVYEMADDILDLTSEAADSCHDVYHAYSDVYDKCEEWYSEHYWIDI